MRYIPEKLVLKRDIVLFGELILQGEEYIRKNISGDNVYHPTTHRLSHKGINITLLNSKRGGLILNYLMESSVIYLLDVLLDLTIDFKAKKVTGFIPYNNFKKNRIGVDITILLGLIVAIESNHTISLDDCDVNIKTVPNSGTHGVNTFSVDNVSIINSPKAYKEKDFRRILEYLNKVLIENNEYERIFITFDDWREYIIVNPQIDISTSLFLQSTINRLFTYSFYTLKNDL